MRRVSNWLFGGFFRTIGRTLAFLLIGGLLGIIAYKNNINFYKLLGIETIKADTINYSSVQYRLFYYEFNGDDWVQGSTSYTNAGTSITNMQYKPVWGWNTQINMGNQTLVAGRTYKITMTYTLQPASNYLYGHYKSEIYWDNPVGTGNSNGSNLSQDNIDRFSATWEPNCPTCARNSVVYYVTPAVDLKVLQVRLRIMSNNYALTGNEPQIGFTTFNQPSGDYIKITYTTDESAIAIQEQTTIIEQQTDTIINGQQEIKDTLVDDNIADNEYSEQLEDLELNNDTWQGPFSAFLLLPLNWVQNILASNQVCRPINLPLPYTDKTLTLPCMTEFWQQLGTLGTFVQLVWIAIVGVRIFNGLFLLTIDVTSAKGNADELTKIRSWEL